MSADGFEFGENRNEMATIYRCENLFLKRTNMMSDMGGISWQCSTTDLKNTNRTAVIDISTP